MIESAAGEAIAVLNHNKVMAYLVPAELYEDMLDRLDDMALVEVAKTRLSEKGEPVDINAL